MTEEKVIDLVMSPWFSQNSLARESANSLARESENRLLANDSESAIMIKIKKEGDGHDLCSFGCGLCD